MILKTNNVSADLNQTDTHTRAPAAPVSPATYLGSSVASTEKDIDTRLTKAWTAINRLSIIWKSDLTDKMKRSFFQAAVTSILLYGCTTWTLTKRLENKLDGNYTRMLRAILNKSRRQHPTRQQLYGHLPPITKTIQVRRAKHAGHCWRSRDELGQCVCVCVCVCVKDICKTRQSTKICLRRKMFPQIVSRSNNSFEN